MAQPIEVPGQGIIEFPDGMTDAQIAKAIEANFGGKKSSSWKDYLPNTLEGYLPNVSNLNKALGTVGRGVASVVEPVATIATGMAAIPIANVAGVAGDIYSGVTGSPRIGEQVASDVAGALTYQPRGQEGKENLESFAKAFNDSKLAGLPVVGQELPMLARGIQTDAQALALRSKIAQQNLSQGLRNTGKDLMTSAVKPTVKEHLTGDASKAIDLLLERGINPTVGGVQELKSLIYKLNDQIKSAIAESPAQVKVSKVVKSLESERNAFLKQVNPSSDVAAIEKAYQEFINHPLLRGKDNIPVQLAQELKVGTYKQLHGKYNGELGTADTAAQKGLARGLKNQIAEEVPTIAQLNAEDSALINALNVVEKRAYMDLNKNPIGLALFAHNPATFAAYLADKSAAFKSLIARGLYKAGNKVSPDFGPAQIKQAEGLSLSPMQGEPLVPPMQRMPAPEGRGLLSLADEQQQSMLPKIEGLDYPLEPRVGPMYGPQPARSGLQLLPKEDYPPNIQIPSVEPQMKRGLLSLADDYKLPEKLPKVETTDFILRQEVLQKPEIVAATEAFSKQANDLIAKYNAASGFWKNRYASELNTLQEKFDAGMRQLGIDKASEAVGLQKLYQGGEGTKLPILKVQGMMR